MLEDTLLPRKVGWNKSDMNGSCGETAILKFKKSTRQWQSLCIIISREASIGADSFAVI